MTYEIPEPESNPLAALVMNYKLIKEVEYDDRVWDKRNWGRSMAAAKDLLEICKIYEMSKRCLEELSKHFNDSNLSWTFETVTKHAHDWKNKQRGQHDRKIRQRFLDDLARQRTERESKKKGEVVTGRTILGPLGNLEVFQCSSGDKITGIDGTNGSYGKRVEPERMEEKEA